MYQVEERQSFSFWIMLLILPLFIILGWSSRDVLQSNVRNLAVQFSNAPLFGEARKSELVIPIPEKDVVKPEQATNPSGPKLDSTPVDSI